MPGPVFLADDAEPALGSATSGDVVRLSGSEARHAVTVLRVRVDDPVELVDGQGRRVRGRVSETARASVEVRVEDVVDEAQVEPLIVVAQALAKGDRAERAVESLTEVGVDEIVPWTARRSVSRWDDRREERGVARWIAMARSATKQARRSRMPRIAEPTDLEGICARVVESTLALVLDPKSTTPIGDVEMPDDGACLIVVGPEGGLDDAEVDALRECGGIPVLLGPSILRTSTAGTVAAGIVMSRCRRWRP